MSYCSYCKNYFISLLGYWDHLENGVCWLKIEDDTKALKVKAGNRESQTF